jgi:hypothetical protein
MIRDISQVLQPSQEAAKLLHPSRRYTLTVAASDDGEVPLNTLMNYVYNGYNDDPFRQFVQY